MTIPFDFADRLKMPLIVAPMFLVSNPAMTIAACRAGVMGSYPAHSTRTREVFGEWLVEGADALIAVAGGAGGHCGTINPFALVSEIKQVTDKPIILAGGLTSGQDVLAG